MSIDLDWVGDLISKIGPLFLLSSVAWFVAIGGLGFSIFETGDYGFKVAHVFRSTQPADTLFAYHKQWANRVLWWGIASFTLTRAVTYTAGVGFPGGGMRTFLVAHIVIGVVCVSLYFLARTLLTGVKHRMIHHWIVIPGLGVFFLLVIPSGIWLYVVTLFKVLARAHISL